MEDNYQEILKAIDEQADEVSYLEESQLSKFQRKYAQDLDDLSDKYPSKNKRSKKVIFLGIILALFFIVTPVMYYLDNIQYNLELKRDAYLEASNDIAYLDDLSNDYDLANNIQYVISSYDKIPYDKNSNGILVYNYNQVSVSIYVNRIIDENNNYRLISDCYQNNDDINQSLNKCLVKDKVYIISRIDKAIIEEENFFNNYYSLKEQDI